jgi:hypothetical protein
MSRLDISTNKTPASPGQYEIKIFTEKSWHQEYCGVEQHRQIIFPGWFYLKRGIEILRGSAL